jgi:hypothetical protein
MKSLYSGKFDIDVLFIDSLEVFYCFDLNTFIIDDYVVSEKVFDRLTIEKIIFGFFYDICCINEKEEISISLLIEI